MFTNGDTSELKAAPLYEANTVDIETLLENILHKPSILTLLALTLGCLLIVSSSFSVYMLVFTGFLPPDSSWTCTSQHCTELEANFNISEEKKPTFYTVDTICSYNFEENVDYIWGNLTRTTYAVEFGKVCHSSDLALLNSVYFIGAILGLLLGSFFFELLGRRKSGMAGGVLAVIGHLMGFFCTDYYFLLCLRVLTGTGTFLASTGTYVWSLEFLTMNMRMYFSAWTGVLWASGYLCLISIGYLITEWHYIFLACSITTVLFITPLLFLPDSPRYLLSVGRVEEAKKVLEAFSKLNGKPLDLSGVQVISSQNKDTEAKKMSYRKQIITFLQNRAMRTETFVMYWLWFCVCLMYYGCQYGWGSFGDSIYTTFLFVAGGEMLAAILKLGILKLLGRKLCQITCFTGAFVCFSVGMIDSVWSEVWNLERLVTTLGVIFISAGFSMVYLYTGELAPTTHRGLVLSSCSIVARIAAFIGPFVSTMSDNRRMKLGLNVFLAGSSAMLAFILPETETSPIPEYAADVTIRRQNQNLRSIRLVFDRKRISKSQYQIQNEKEDHLDAVKV